jgi:hypothetical protein
VAEPEDQKGFRMGKYRKPGGLGGLRIQKTRRAFGGQFSSICEAGFKQLPGPYYSCALTEEDSGMLMFSVL